MIEIRDPTTANRERKISLPGTIGMRCVMPQLDTVHTTPFIVAALLMAMRAGSREVRVVRMVIVELTMEMTEPRDAGVEAVMSAPRRRFAAVIVTLLMSRDRDVPWKPLTHVIIGAVGTVMVEAPLIEKIFVPSRVPLKYKSAALGTEIVLALINVTCTLEAAPVTWIAPSVVPEEVNVQPAMEITMDDAVELKSTILSAATKVDADAIIENVFATAPMVMRWLPVDDITVLEATESVVCVIPVVEIMADGEIKVTLFRNVMLPRLMPPPKANIADVVDTVNAPLRLTENVVTIDDMLISVVVVDVESTLAAFKLTAVNVMPECDTLVDGKEYNPFVALMVVPLSSAIDALVTPTPIALKIVDENVITAFDVAVMMKLDVIAEAVEIDTNWPTIMTPPTTERRNKNA